MHRRLRVLPWYFSLLMVVSCAGQPSLSGTIQLAESEEWATQVYLIDPVRWDAVGRSYVGRVLDSAYIDAQGQFSFTSMPTLTTPKLLQLAVQQKGEQYANQLTNEPIVEANYLPFVWEGTSVQLEAEIAHFQASAQLLNPSSTNAAILALRNLRQQAFSVHTAAHEAETLLEEEDQLRAQQEVLMDFARETKDLLPALLAIRWVSIPGNYERIPEFLVQQCEHWQAEAPDHPWVRELCVLGDRNQLPILLGDTIPDFSLPMHTGDTLSLQALLAQRLTLLDLWASWCAPCRVQNRDYLVPLWEAHHAAGFQIIGYALDASQKAWTRAISADGADRWLHASDLNGDDAPLLDRLRLQTIPANLLIDAEGRVVAKNLHGEALMDFVQKWMATH